MKKSITYLFVFIAFSFNACGQSTNKTNNRKSEKTTKMNIENLTNTTVRKAIEALSVNDKTAWFSLFTSDATFTDDGQKQDFKPFFENAFAHKEKFLTIDKVENDGKDIYGNFFAGQWGTFKVYFKFHINSEGKITRLDIGQTH